jgi:hypothetical protein
MNNKKNADFNHLSIDELASSSIAEIRENLSDSELNGVTGGIVIDFYPDPGTGCQACTSGYDPRFDDKAL